MVGKLFVIVQKEEEDDGLTPELRDIIGKESAEDSVDIETADFYFRSEDVKTLWRQTNPEGSDAMIISIKGATTEYPLEYDEYIFTSLKKMLTKV